MTLKKELEVLRGEPIKVFTGNPMDIPCIETSDPEKLCTHPVVSVSMITYNHEPYIRQAIEGVMMQKTDFEFELIIGEDCSTDKTREICFEYQKKYPDKIRVLWWHENVSGKGGNGRRSRAHCRGEFVALCEGDDYWIDPHKLQKQVNVFRENPSVELCFARAKIMTEGKGDAHLWDPDNKIPHGVIKGRDFFKWHSFGRFVDAPGGAIEFLMTASTMSRRSTYCELTRKHPIFNWRLRLSDTTLWSGLSTCGDVYYLPDVVSVYRLNPTGICRRNPFGVCVDTQIIRLYWLKALNLCDSFPIQVVYGRLFVFRLRYIMRTNPKLCRNEAKKIRAIPEFNFVRGGFRWFIVALSQPFIPNWVMRVSIEFLSGLRAWRRGSV